jgi:primosomal protein N' (replication factor Y) (superfamily II helicase)
MSDGGSVLLAEVALPLPLPRTFAYTVPGELVETALPGARVRVPFGRRERSGWIDTLRRGVPTGKERALLAVEEEPAPPAVLELCRWISRYYFAPLGVALRAAVPPPVSSAPPLQRRVVRLARELPSLAERMRLFARAPRQRECVEALEGLGGVADLAHLTGRLGFSDAVVRALEGKGVVSVADEERARDPYAGRDDAAPSPPPTAAQAAVIEALVEGARGAEGRPFLLHGVTGSGKTLVYVELLREVVERQGRGAIVLVPEISLTPQTVARFRAAFGDQVAVVHSALSEGERRDAWRAIRAGEKRVVIGARSAIFAPLQDLGAVVVDEEHEATYKQGEAPRYHARDVAAVRAGMEGAVCLFGSATPSLESWEHVRSGRFRLLELPERIGALPMPPIEVVDLRRERERRREAGRATRREEGGEGGGEAGEILSSRLRAEVEIRLERGEQTILLLNRRGYASFAQCRACGEVWACPHCSVSLTHHRARRRLVCHHCFHEEEVPELCRLCGSDELTFRGVGTEQVERAVGDAFPAARVARMDVDTTGGKWSHHRILERVERREVDILLGTQMIAKGLDFPNVTLVGVVNADVGINLPDFRASERTFQLLAQVAGRAGRGPRGGLVIIQTSLPDHYVVTHALTHDYAGFAARELNERLEPTYPPHTRLVNVVVSGEDELATQAAVETAVAWVRDLLRTRRVDDVTLTGPAPCAISRIRGRWRWHFLLRSPRGTTLGAVGRYFAERYRPAGDIRVIVDRDPVSLL